MKAKLRLASFGSKPDFFAEAQPNVALKERFRLKSFVIYTCFFVSGENGLRNFAT